MKEVDNIAQLQNDIRELEQRYRGLQHAHAILEQRCEELKTNKNFLVETILTNEAKEKNYRKIIDNSPSALFLTKPDGTILEANKTSSDILGYTESEFRQMGRQGFIDHSSEDIKRLLDERKRTGKLRGEVTAIKKNGERIQAEFSSFIFKDPATGEERTSVVMTDISARIEAEKALLDSEKNYKELFNLNPLPMWIYDYDTTRFLAVNEAAIRHYGYSRDEFLQMSVLDIRPPEVKEQLLTKGAHVHATSNLYHGYWKNSKKDGEIINVEITAQLISYAGRQATLVLANDVTSKIQVESKLIKSNRRLQASQQIAKLGYWELNLSTLELYLSEQSYAILELKPGGHPLTYHDFFRMIHPDDKKLFIKKQNAVLNGEKKVTVEHRIVLANGAIKTLIETGNLICNEEGVAIFFEGTVQDITERKKAQDKLDKSREWANLIFSNTTDLMFLIEVMQQQDKYRCIKVNPAYLELTGLPAENLIGKFVEDILPEKEAQFVIRQYKRAIQEKQTIIYEEEVDLPSGYMIVETKLTPVLNDAGEPILLLGVARNITERKKAEKIIADNERRMKIAQKLGNVGDWEFDCQTGKLRWSDELFRLFKKDPAKGAPSLEEFISMYAPPDDTSLRTYIQQAIETGNNYELDLQLSLGSKPLAYHYSVGQVLKNDIGAIVKLYGIVQDITERKLAEIKLNAERNQLRTLIDTLPDSIYIKDLSGRKIITNKVDRQLMGGKSEEDVIGKTDIDIFSDNRGLASFEDDMEIIKTGNPILNREESFIDENGTEVFILTSKVPILTENGHINGLLGIGRVITERKQAELALKQSNERYLYATKATSDAIWDWDIIHDHLYWGEGYEKIFGYKVPDKVENHIDSFDNIHPDDRKLVFDHINECLAGNELNWKSAYRYKKANGEYAFVEDKGIIIRDNEGKAIRMIGAMQDVTEKKLADEAIKNSQEKFSSLVNTIEGIVWEADVNTFQSIYTSKYAETLLGYPLWNWLHEPGFWASHLHPDDRDWVIAYCHKCIREKKNYQFEYRMIASDGRVIWLADIVNIDVQNDVPIRLSGITVDISERKKMEETLTKERKLLRILIDNLPDYIYVKDKNSRHVINNKANVQLLGFRSEEETLNKTIVELLGGNIANNFMEDDHLVLETGQSIINREEPIDETNGRRWLLTTKIPIKDDSNHVTGLVGISRDITQRKKTDEELIEKNEQLKHLSKHLLSIREEERKMLAREVHDELGQLASVVKMDIDWLTLRLSDVTEGPKKRMEHASSTADLLINTIRKIAANLRPSMLDELGLNAALAWQCKEFASVNGIDCEFEQIYDDEELAVEIKTELFRICQESLTNIMRHAAATKVLVNIHDTRDGIRMCISDNGKGFDTTQKKNRLGLIGMRERVLSIKGTLSVESKPGKGTTICVIIPNTV